MYERLKSCVATCTLLVGVSTAAIAQEADAPRQVLRIFGARAGDAQFG